jgi:hypothetical protein
LLLQPQSPDTVDLNSHNDAICRLLLRPQSVTALGELLLQMPLARMLLDRLEGGTRLNPPW